MIRNVGARRIVSEGTALRHLDRLSSNKPQNRPATLRSVIGGVVYSYRTGTDRLFEDAVGSSLSCCVRSYVSVTGHALLEGSRHED